ncbi:MAG: hypothetical protein IKP64_06200 [Selenomonadaceae bacterium]|nr:hypothetical protein [Selenomonadaceae bacterium]MBR4383134.1 hypothetical protein [Selenomonadaceae bacterium]
MGIFDCLTGVATKAVYLKGKITKPDEKDLTELETISSPDKLANRAESVMNKMFHGNVAEGAVEGLIMIHQAGMLSREDVQHHFEVKHAHENGIRVGELIAAKKFATLLEQSDNMRIGAFALGCHVARLGGNSEEKLGVIVDALGEPDSFALSKYVRSENSKIIRDEPAFGEICNRYLDSLDNEQLKSVDGFVMEILNVGGTSPSEKSFYQYEWTPYLNRRIK